MIYNKPKILIIRFSSIGDIVLTTPVVRCLKQQLGAEIHFLTKKSFRSIIDANPYVDRVYAIQSKPKEVLAELVNERYHFVVDLHHNLRSLRVKLALGVYSKSFHKLNFKKWLLVRLKINRLPDVHIVDRYLDTVAKLGITNDGQGLDYFIPPEQEVNLADVCSWQGERADWRRAVTTGAYTAVIIGAAHATKRMPPTKLLELCQAIPGAILLLGGPDDQATGESIAAAIGARIINTCGRFSLHQSASLVRQAQKVVTHDTGLMHIAAALRKPIVSIWGNTVPAFGMYPYLPAGAPPAAIVEVNDLPCRPCSKIGFNQCPQGHFRCMQQIDPTAVIKALALPVDKQVEL